MKLKLVEDLVKWQNVREVCQYYSFQKLIDDEIGDGKLETKVVALDEFQVNLW